MAEQVTISFYADRDIEALLKAWADEDDRSVSAVIRRAIEAERIRRTRQLPLVADETPESTTQEMNQHGCGRLVEA